MQQANRLTLSSTAPSRQSRRAAARSSLVVKAGEAPPEKKKIPKHLVDFDINRSGLKNVPEHTAERVKAQKSLSAFETAKTVKCGTALWTEVHELADLVKEGKTKWEDLALDDLDVRAKWSGLFHRRKRTPGKFMLRLKIPSGEMTSAQLRAVGEVLEWAGENGCADITTRANIQLRGLSLEQSSDAMKKLMDAGLSSLQSGMDNVRNICTSPIAGVDPHEFLDPRQLGIDINNLLTNHGKGEPRFSNLPRKFNIAISPSRDDFCHTHINDLGFQAVVAPSGELGFNVVLGGLFSAKRNEMSVHGDTFLSYDQVLPYTEALLELFIAHGDRNKDRQKCRFMYMLDAWGTEKLRDEIAAKMGVDELRRAVPEEYPDKWARRDVMGVHAAKAPEGAAAGSKWSWVGAVVPAGRLLPKDFPALATAADMGDGTVRFTQEENVVFPNVPEERLSAMLALPVLSERFEVESGNLMRGLVSCTGSQFCGFGLVETKNRAVELTRALEAELEIPDLVRIHWTGCPNSCGQAQVGDIGLMGSPAKKDGKAVEGVRVMLGGTIGEGATLTEDFEKGIPADELHDYLKDLLISRFGAIRKSDLDASAGTPPGRGFSPSGSGRGDPQVVMANGAQAVAAHPAPPGGREAAAPPPPPPPAAPPLPATLPPPAAYQAVLNAAAMKAAYSAGKTLVLGFMAGCYISLGALLAMNVGGTCAGLASAAGPGLQKILVAAIGVPFGLCWTILTGSELFTGNAFVMTAGVLAKRVTMGDLARNWTLSLAGNVVGCAFMLAATCLACGSLVNPAVAKAATTIAMTKMASTGALFAKGVLGNWLVCLAVWLTTCAQDIPGKYMSIFLCVPAFIALGFEHSVANMMIVPTGILAGAPITWGQFLTTLWPVLVGNAVGGALFMACTMHFAFGKKM